MENNFPLRKLKQNTCFESGQPMPKCCLGLNSTLAFIWAAVMSLGRGSSCPHYPLWACWVKYILPGCTLVSSLDELLWWDWGRRDVAQPGSFAHKGEQGHEVPELQLTQRYGGSSCSCSLMLNWAKMKHFESWTYKCFISIKTKTTQCVEILISHKMEIPILTTSGTDKFLFAPISFYLRFYLNSWKIAK